jgi:hypothetical protein
MLSEVKETSKSLTTDKSYRFFQLRAAALMRFKRFITSFAPRPK